MTSTQFFLFIVKFNSEIASEKNGISQAEKNFYVVRTILELPSNKCWVRPCWQYLNISSMLCRAFKKI
jgi:hypothetical protein